MQSFSLLYSITCCIKVSNIYKIINILLTLCSSKNNVHCFVYICLRRVREDRRKVTGYAEETIPNYLLDDFQRFFRISRTTFETILNEIGEALTPNIQRGRPSMSPEKKLLVTIWYTVHQHTIHRISDRFNITDSSVLRCRDQVFHVVLHSLKKRFIYLPPNGNVKQKIMDDFYTSLQLSFVFSKGCDRKSIWLTKRLFSSSFVVRYKIH